jgi:hypothetical protein
MIDLYEEFLALVDTLSDGGITYAVCGGIAVALWGYPRFTKDIDLLIARDDLDRVLDAVHGLGYTLPSGVLPFDAGTPREREVFRISKAVGEDLITLDLLLVSPVFKDVWRDRMVLDGHGRSISIVSLDGLKQMKRVAGRSQDLADIEHLEAVSQGCEDE